MRALCLFALTCSASAMAQLQVPVAIVLDGAQAEDRQVSGLADPQTSDAGVSVDAARNNATRFTTTTGAAVLVGMVTPAPSAYSAGMSLLVVPTQANTAGAVINLNGLGPVPIVKLGALPLDSADLTVGVPHRLVHDGQRFQLISSGYRPCPAGFHIGAREYCIADSSTEALSFFQAGAYCRSIGARLCTFSEWIHACRSDPAFIGTVLNFEWVDHAANSTAGAKRVGRGSNGATGDDLGIGCLNGSTSDQSNPNRFRCCLSR